MSEFGKRIGYVESVFIQDGAVICRVEDKDTPNKVYDPVIYARSSAYEVSVPPQGAKVLVEKVNGEKIITGVLSSASATGADETAVKDGFEKGAASMSLVFGPREGADGVESIAVEYGSDGYNVDIDVDGEVTLQAGNGFTITDGDGYGIEALDGEGQFKWYAKDIDIDPNPPTTE